MCCAQAAAAGEPSPPICRDRNAAGPGGDAAWPGSRPVGPGANQRSGRASRSRRKRLPQPAIIAKTARHVTTLIETRKKDRSANMGSPQKNGGPRSAQVRRRRKRHGGLQRGAHGAEAGRRRTWVAHGPHGRIFPGWAVRSARGSTRGTGFTNGGWKPPLRYTPHPRGLGFPARGFGVGRALRVFVGRQLAGASWSATRSRSASS